MKDVILVASAIAIAVGQYTNRTRTFSLYAWNYVELSHSDIINHDNRVNLPGLQHTFCVNTIEIIIKIGKTAHIICSGNAIAMIHGINCMWSMMVNTWSIVSWLDWIILQKWIVFHRNSIETEDNRIYKELRIILALLQYMNRARGNILHVAMIVMMLVQQEMTKIPHNAL